MIENPRIDIHIHLVGTGCQCSGCWVHPSFRKRYTIKIIQLLQRISNQQMNSTLDQDWGKKISSLVEKSQVDFGVVLGFDGAVNMASGEIDLDKSQMIIPSQWVFQLCRKYKNLLPGPSINPHAANSMEHLEYCISEKAALIKWLPSAQLIDPSEKSLSPFYKTLANSGIPLLIHCGGEKTFKSLNPKLNNVERLIMPLEHGVKVICAHSATSVIGSKEEDQMPQLLELMGQYENLWVDNSGICNPARHFHLPKIAKNKILTDKTLYGSDFPVPSNAFYYLTKIGVREVLKLERNKNLINRDIEIKKFFGYPDETLTRANHVLANLNHWNR